MKKTDFAYVAGIIDGEGCIYLYHTKKCRATYLKVSVGSSDQWLCEMLAFSFGGNVRRVKSKTLPFWIWEINTRQAGQFLESILPYLHLKRPQAELAIRFQKARSPRGGIRRTDAQKAVEEAQFILMKNLKRQKEAIKEKRETGEGIERF